MHDFNENQPDFSPPSFEEKGLQRFYDLRVAAVQEQQWYFNLIMVYLLVSQLYQRMAILYVVIYSSRYRNIH